VSWALIKTPTFQDYSTPDSVAKRQPAQTRGRSSKTEILLDPVFGTGAEPLVELFIMNAKWYRFP
jgi:hypothetical protein